MPPIAKGTRINGGKAKRKSSESPERTLPLTSKATVPTVRDGPSHKKRRVAPPETESPPTSDEFLGGSFDIYGMPLDFLQKALKPHSSSTPDYEALYNKIVPLQPKRDNMGQLVLTFPVDAEYGYGRPSPSAQKLDCLKLSADEQDDFYPSPPADGPGVEATIVLNEDMCGISGLSGLMKIFLNPVYTHIPSSKPIYLAFISVNFAFWMVPSISGGNSLTSKGLEHLGTAGVGSKKVNSFVHGFSESYHDFDPRRRYRYDDYDHYDDYDSEGESDEYEFY
ncbi:hypothetical protein DL96DRAFT_1779020 [Flagelloscypha sp. PMI_526]|nr:hypothetical protein DL96DRAFT_1779020 [Flagelloscypha sp. PMI_526]